MKVKIVQIIYLQEVGMFALKGIANIPPNARSLMKKIHKAPKSKERNTKNKMMKSLLRNRTVIKIPNQAIETRVTFRTPYSYVINYLVFFFQ